MKAARSSSTFTHGRPRLHGEVGFGLAGNEVHLAAVGFDEVDHDMSIRSPPLGAGIDLVVAQQCGGKDGAVGDTSCEVRLVRAKERLLDERMDSISRHYGVRLHPVAVGKHELHLAVREWLDPDQLVIKVDRFGRYCARQRSVQDRRGG